MGNCNATYHHADQLRLVTASVQILRLNIPDDGSLVEEKQKKNAPKPKQQLPTSVGDAPTEAPRIGKRGFPFFCKPMSPEEPARSRSWPALVSPASKTEHKRSVSASQLNTDELTSSTTTATTTTATTTKSPRASRFIAEPSTVEITFTAPLPHSRFCKRLRMRRTADFDRVVAPLVAPGARLKITYDPSTLMIHVLERDEERPRDDASYACGAAMRASCTRQDGSAALLRNTNEVR